MASSLFPQNQNSQGSNGNSILSLFKSLVGNDPQAAFNHMYQNDPRFRQFADSMKGKTPEQAFSEHGLDYSQFRNFMQ